MTLPYYSGTIAEVDQKLLIPALIRNLSSGQKLPISEKSQHLMLIERAFQ